MDAFLLSRFVQESAPLLQNATVQRVVCVADGLVLELQRPAQPPRAELGLLGPSGAAWAYCRTGEPVPGGGALASPLPPEPGLAFPGGTALDALRAWLLRPAATAPVWMRLQGTRLLRLHAPAGDRTLFLVWEEVSLTQSTRLELVAELFDRSANFILRDADGRELANWKSRRPAPPRSVPPEAAPPAAAPASLTQAAFTALAAASARGLARAHRRAASQRERRLRARIAALERDASRARQGEVWRHQAEALSAQLHRVRRGQSRVQLDDPYAPGQRLTIDLDPSLAPHENAALLFKRARRAARGLPTIAARLQAAQHEHAQARQAVSEIATLEADPALTWTAVLRVAAPTWRSGLTRALASAPRALLWAPGGPPWEAPPATEASERRGPAGPGRSFLLPGGWEVRVGRNNRENDELTHRFARADDVWLHASGVPGSHVVLRMQGRKDNPPREILEMAAAIAARYSQAKHARTVPVIWTRKRYVRKPRRGAPGLAACTHEKTLFVAPGLPRGEDDDEA